MDTNETQAPDPLPPPNSGAQSGAAPSMDPGERPKAYRAPSKDPLAQIADALREITPVLDASDMEPDQSRMDWSRSRGQIDAAHGLYKGDVLPVIDEAFAAMPSGSDLRLKVSANVAWIGAELASLLYASKRTDDAQRVLLQISRFAPAAAADGTNIKAEVDGAIADTAAWVELMRARYLQRHQQWDEGDRVLRAAKGKAKDPVIKAAIAKQLGGARPLTGVPPLFRINGCGASIYGERDRRSDGSYVTTYCVALLFIPVWPISAYRVKDGGNGSYQFMAKEPVSAFARGYRWFLVSAMGLGVVVSMAGDYLNDPRRLAANEFADVSASVASMPREDALRAWEGLAQSRGGSLTTDARETTGTELTRLLLDGVASPMTVARIGEVESALARHRALPDLAHGAAQQEMVLGRVLDWQDDIGSATQADALASMRVLDALSASDAATTALADAEGLLYGARAPSYSSAPTLVDRRALLHRVLGEQLATEWPLEAIDHWTLAGDVGSLELAGTALRELSSSRSLLLEVETPVTRYLHATNAGEPRDTIALAMDAARTMAADEGRRLALESGEPAALNAVLDSYPGDQETIAALAQSKRQSGDLAGAHALLDPLGAPGRLSGAAQLARANLLADEGHLDQAVTLLSHHVAAHLPPFQSAQRAYRTAFDARTAELEAQLRSPYPPMDLENQVRNVVDDDEVRGIVQTWFMTQLTNDANLASLRTQLDATSGVVPGVLQLAMLELRLGNDTSGETRAGHLREAERLFLAIRDEAEGLPSFHLGLGQVYHRLGRTQEGDAEIGQVLAMGEPALELEAAYTYRDLGLTTQTSEIAQRVYDSGAAPHAQAAAMLMSLLTTTLEDEEMWLSRADQTNEFVQINLLQVRARRVARDGNLREADRLFGQVAERFLALSSHDQAALNNAAIALEQRYECSGNPAHLARAVDLMEQALRRAPESGITASNLSEIITYAGHVAVLDGFVHTRELHLDGRSADELVDWLLSGSQHDAVLAALREEPRLRRAVEVARQAQVLAPQRTNPYQTELDALERIDDAAALTTLAERVARVPNLETATAATEAERWHRGELDGTIGPTYDAAITTLTERANGLRAGHAPTHAAACVLLARRLVERTQLTRDPADFVASEAALLEAETAAPGWGAAYGRGWSMIARGVVELAQTNSAAQLVVEDGWRSAPLGVLCTSLAADSSSRDAARAHATLRDGIALLHGSRHHGLQTLACASLLDDQALVTEARAQLATDTQRRAFAISVALTPWSRYQELGSLLP